MLKDFLGEVSTQMGLGWESVQVPNWSNKLTRVAQPANHCMSHSIFNIWYSILNIQYSIFNDQYPIFNVQYHNIIFEWVGQVCSWKANAKESDIQYPIFNIQYSILNIQCSIFNIQYPIFNVQYHNIIFEWVGQVCSWESKCKGERGQVGKGQIMTDYRNVGFDLVLLSFCRRSCPFEIKFISEIK